MPIFSDLKASLHGLFGSSAVDTLASAPAPPVPETPTSHTRPDNINSDILLLQMGESFGSRFDAAHLHEAGLKVGARIIGVDRPGMGLSSPQPDRTLLDYPKNLEHLADHLKLERYGVMGVSGGGPYALACAFELPSERLKCVSIVGGLGPAFEIGMKGARWVNKIGFAGGYRYCPHISRIFNQWFWQLQPCGLLDLSEDQRLERHMKALANPRSTSDKKDAEVMADEINARRFLQSTGESFAQGYDAALQDGKLLSSDFCFHIQDIRPDLPVQLWYGKQDVYIPLKHGETIAKRLGGDRATLRIEDETHASIFFKWREHILEEMVKRI